MEYSESFYITISTLGVSALGLFLWYFKSILMTSRCSNVSCLFGCLKLENKVVEDDTLQQIIVNEAPPPIPAIEQSKTADRLRSENKSSYQSATGRITNESGVAR